MDGVSFENNNNLFYKVVNNTTLAAEDIKKELKVDG